MWKSNTRYAKVCNADVKLALAGLDVRYDPKDGINYSYPLSEKFLGTIHH